MAIMTKQQQAERRSKHEESEGQCGLCVDARHQPLMPGCEKRARLLLKRWRAVIHRVVPLYIRLNDRCVEASRPQLLAASRGGTCPARNGCGVCRTGT